MAGDDRDCGECGCADDGGVSEQSGFISTEGSNDGAFEEECEERDDEEV